MAEGYHAVWYDCRMNEDNEIIGFWSFFKAVLVKPAWDFYTVGGIFTFLFVTTWWRDNFASEDLKKMLELRVILPHWHPAWWLCIALAVLVYLVARNSFALWTEQSDANRRLRSAGGVRQNEGLPMTAPQVNLLALTRPEMGSIEQLLLRNLSSDPLYNLAFQPVKLSDTLYVNWMPNDIALFEGSSSVVISLMFTRVAEGGSAMQFGGISQLMRLLKQGENRLTYSIGNVAFSCEDKVQNRYLVTFTVEVNFQGNTLILKDTEKVLIGNRPNVYSPSIR